MKMAESKTLEPTLKRHVHPIAMMVVMTIAAAIALYVQVPAHHEVCHDVL